MDIVVNLDTVLLCITLIIVIGMISYMYYYAPSYNYTYPVTYMYDKQQVQPVQPIIDTNNNAKNINIDVNKQTDVAVPTIGEIMRDYDYRAYSDPLTPPYKRDDFTLPYPSFPTRGYPTAFKKVGYLMDKDADNADKYKFMILMGRQKYSGSDYYDYYVTENNTDSVLKFDLHHRHREILTGDEVHLKELNKKYIAKIDKTLGYEYYPYY
jgi:hypothetical protein